MDFASKELTAGQLNAIVKDLGGAGAAIRFLRGEIDIIANPRAMKPWKKLTLGLYKNANEYRQALKLTLNKVGDWGEELLNAPAFKCSVEVINVDLVVLSLAELGFRHGARPEEIMTQAQTLGLKLCPAEVGPALRLAYEGQKVRQSLIVAMEQISISSRENHVLFSLAVTPDDSPWLHGTVADPKSIFGSGYEFVFVQST